MAIGDPWNTDRLACDYVSDNGGTYRFRALEKYQAQSGLGWVASTDPTLTSMPRGFRPRRFLTWAAGNHAHRRTVVVATNTAYAAGVPGTTTFLVQNPSTNIEALFTLYGKEGERHRGVEAD